MMKRRTLLRAAAAAPLGLAGCGFHPLYMAGHGDTNSAAAQELAAIHIVVLGERVNQLLYLALEDHLQRFGIASAKRYDLTAPIGIGGEGIGVDPYSDVTRIRYNASVSWTLRRRDPDKTLVRTGLARVIDGVNIVGSQFFSGDQETDAEYRSFATTLADQIVLQLATYFDEQARVKAA